MSHCNYDSVPVMEHLIRCVSANTKIIRNFGYTPLLYQVAKDSGHSSRCVSEPGMSIADLVYTVIPLNGITTQQYFIESWASGIW